LRWASFLVKYLVEMRQRWHMSRDILVFWKDLMLNYL
jgi:hypothetical protein